MWPPAPAVVGHDLGAALRNDIPISGQRILIVDDTGAVVADSHVGAAPGDVRARSALHAASLRAGAGTYATGGETHYFTATGVDGAPWRVVVTVPTASLYSPLRGVQQVPWLVFACFVVVASFAWWLLWRLVRSRAELDLVSRVDSLTGLYNRRHLRAQAAQPTPVDGSTSMTPTVSVGCAAGVDGPPDVLVAQANAALYEAKRAGRDRVVTAPASRAEVGAGGRTGGTVG